MAMPLIEDEALPGLAPAMRVEPMLRNLATVIEARTAGAWSVAGGRLIRFRYRRGARAILQYELDVIGPSGPSRIPASAWLFAGGKAKKHAGRDPAADPQALPPIVMEPASGALVYLFPADRHTPQVSRFLRGHTAFAAQLLRCEPTAAPEIVRYRPGLGATFRWPGQAWAVYVKIVPNWQSEQAQARLEALTILCRGTPVGVPWPLGAINDLGALSLAEVGGIGFADILANGRIPEISNAAERVAGALAAFHRLDSPPNIKQRDPDVMIKRAHSAARLIGAVSGALGRKAEEIAKKVAAGPRPVGSALTHMDMKIEHLMLGREKVTLLDLDSMALADPVNDVAMLDARIAACATSGKCTPDQALAARVSLTTEYAHHAPSGWSDSYSLLRASAALQVAKHQVQNPAPQWQYHSEQALDMAFADPVGGVTGC